MMFPQTSGPHLNQHFARSRYDPLARTNRLSARIIVDVERSLFLDGRDSHCDYGLILKLLDVRASGARDQSLPLALNGVPGIVHCPSLKCDKRIQHLRATEK